MVGTNRAQDILTAHHSSHPPNTFRSTFLRPTLLGAIDGLITSFVIIAGGIAGDVAKSSVLIIALSSLVADGLSMGVSESISSRSQDALTYDLAFKKGLVCFASFVLFGIVPIFVYFVTASAIVSQIAISLTFVLMLVIAGWIRAALAREKYLLAIIEVVVLGVSAGAVAYLIASSLPH